MPKHQEDREPRARLDEGAYDATVLSVGLPEESTYTDPKTKKEKTQEKVQFNFLVKQEDGTAVEIPAWAGNTVSRGAGTYSNSKLYNFLDALGYLKEYNDGIAKLEDDVNFNVWLNDKFKKEQPKVQVIIKNSWKGDKEKEYSSVREILKRYK